MGDLTNVDRMVLIKKYEHEKVIAIARIHEKEIRIIELLDEMVKCRADIGKSMKVIERCNLNIKLQEETVNKTDKE